MSDLRKKQHNKSRSNERRKFGKKKNPVEGEHFDKGYHPNSS